MQRHFERLKTRLHGFLRWSERYTKTDMVYLARGGWWLSGAQAIGVGSSLVITIGLANLIPPDVYGNYRFVLSLAAIISVFTLTGMGPAITQAVARGYEGALHTGVFTKLKWSIGITVAALFVAGYYYLNDNMVLAGSLLAVGALAPLQESFKLYRSYLTGKKAFRTNTYYKLIEAPIVAGLFLSTLWFTDNIIFIILAYFGINAALQVGLYFWTIHTFAPRAEIDPKTIGYSKHLSVMNVIGRVAGNLDNILLFHFLGAAPLAMYAIAKAAPKQAKGMMGIIQQLALPKLAQRDLTTLKYSVPKKTLLLFSVSAVVFITYIVIAPFLFALVFPQYIDAVIYSQVLALTILYVPMLFIKQTFTAHMRTRELYIIRSSTPFVRIGLLLVLVPLFGIWGAVGTVLAEKTYDSLLSLYLFWRMT